MYKWMRVLGAFFLFEVMIFGGLYAAETQPALTRTVTVFEMKGPVQIKTADSAEWRNAQAGDVLYQNDEIRTADGGFALLYLDDKAETGKVELKEKSHLKLSTMEINPVNLEKITYLDLALGKVLVRAQKLKGNSKFEVKTPTASAGVRGTVFEVSVEE